MIKWNYPNFWYKDPDELGFIYKILGYAGKLYNKVAKFNGGFLIKEEELSIPVICSGELTRFCSGKTLLAIEIHRRLKGIGIDPHFLKFNNNKIAKNKVHIVSTIQDVYCGIDSGDLLLASRGKTWLSSNIYKAGVAAYNDGAKAIVIDGGLQNYSLRKDFSIITIDIESSFGNGYISPFGPLYQNLDCGVKKADWAILIGGYSCEKRQNNVIKVLEKHSVPYVHASVKLAESGLSFENVPVVAFSGISSPKKFFHFLEKNGALVKKFINFPNGFAFNKKILDRMVTLAQRHGALLVTTEEDMFKVPEAYIGKVVTVPIFLHLNDWKVFDVFCRDLKTKFVC